MSISLLQDWTSVAEKWGFPVAALVVLIIFLWKGLLPFIKGQIEKTQTILQEQAAEARKSRDEERQLRREEVAKFVESLHFRDQEFQKVVIALERINK